MRRAQALGLGLRGRAARPRSPRAAAGLADAPGLRRPEPEARRCRSPRSQLGAAAARDAVRERHVVARRARGQGRSYLDVVRGMRGSSRTRPTASRSRPRRRSCARVLAWCGERDVAVVPFGGGTSVVGGVDAPPGPGPRRARGGQPAAAGPRARGRPRLARRAHPGRRDRPAARGAARRARADAALLPAVVRALDARRLDRHPRGRPLRDRADARRRPRRVRARADGRRGDVWESRRLPGSGAGPSPDRHAARLGGHARGHHRGVGARAAAAGAARRSAAVRVRLLRGRRRRRCARSCRPGCGPPTAA